MASIWDINNITNQITGSLRGAFNAWPSGAGSMYYNGGNYGQTQDWYNSPISQNIREQNLPLAYAAYGSRAGVSDNNTAFSRWFQQQMPRFERARGLAAMNNPTMTIDQFMNTLPQYRQLRNEYEAQSPLSRGAQYAQFAPSARWIPR